MYRSTLFSQNDIDSQDVIVHNVSKVCKVEGSNSGFRFVINFLLLPLESSLRHVIYVCSVTVRPMHKMINSKVH